METITAWIAHIDWLRVLGVAASVVITLILCKIGISLGKIVIEKIMAGKNDKKGSKRNETLNSVMFSVWKYMLYFVAGVTILKSFGIDTTAILASAGVLGLAVGFGAQNFVKDVISGFFIILDNYFNVGDYIKCGSVTGFVQEIGLRTTKMTDWCGEQHVFPNGQIVGITNYSRGYQRSMIQIPVGADVNLEQVFAVLNNACEKMKANNTLINDGPAVLGVTKVENGVVTICLSFTALVENQGGLEKEMRKIAKEYLDDAGIGIAKGSGVVVTNTNEFGEAKWSTN